MFGKSKFSTPRIIEHCNDGKHIFETRCSKCGKILTKLTLPSPANIQKIGGDAWQDLGAFFFDRISDGIRVGIKEPIHLGHGYIMNQIAVGSFQLFATMLLKQILPNSRQKQFPKAILLSCPLNLANSLKQNC